VRPPLIRLATTTLLVCCSGTTALLQSFIPLNNIGTAEHPVYEGTPVHIMGFFASIPLGFVIYGVAAYAALRLLRRGT
jgi:hypothetical protein